MINSELVQKIASLARLKLTDEEIENFTKQMNSTLDYVNQLGSADTSGVEPTSLMVPAHDPLRDDVETESLSHDEILSNGPNVKKDHFAIPKVIGN